MHFTLCLLVTLYTGSVDAKSAHTDIASECKIVSLEKARKAIQKCSEQPADKCEVIVNTKENNKVTIEQKIVVKVVSP